MGRSPCCVKEGLNKGAWTSQEDKLLKDYIKIHGEGKWRSLPKRAGLKRCGKSCRLRWLNYLRPDIKRGNITDDEEDLIIRLHKLLGNRWSLIAGRLPGRTDNEIKNYWNTNISKRLINQSHHIDAQDQAAAAGGSGNRRRLRRLSNGNPNPPTAAGRSHESELKLLNLNNKNNNNNNNNGPPCNNNNNNKKNKNGPEEGSLTLTSSSSTTYVVRTKATRCTKFYFNVARDELLVLDLHDQTNNNYDQHQLANNNIGINCNNNMAEMINTRRRRQQQPVPIVNDGDDDNFLSDFLSSTSSAPFKFNNLDFSDIDLLSTTTPAAPAANNNNNNNLCSQDGTTISGLICPDQNCSELASMASLLDPAALEDWFQLQVDDDDGD